MDNLLTTHVTQFIAYTNWEKIPSTPAKLPIFDHLSVGLAGLQSEAGRLIQEYVAGG